MTIKEKVFKFIIKRLLDRANSQYRKKYNRNLQIIAITGNIGKSSQTLLINQLLEKNGWQVFSGTTLERGLNSLTGLGLCLTNKQNFNIEGMSSIAKMFKILVLLIQLFLDSCLYIFNFTEKSILVYEIGYDHQGESQLFTNLFPHLDLLICTNLAWEHSSGYDKSFNITSHNHIISQLPLSLRNAFESALIESKLKNIAIEQLTLILEAKKTILPNNIGELDGTIETNLFENKWQTFTTQTQRQNDGSLLINDELLFNSKYLLPFTFGKTILVSSLVGYNLGLKQEQIQSVLSTAQLPRGRFGKLEGVKKTTIIDSTYNSDPESLLSFLNSFEETVHQNKNTDILEQQGRTQAPKHTLILGEMRELGDKALEDHKNILLKLTDLQAKYSDYIEDIILLGSEWLECDDNNILKENQDYRLITFQKNIFKVFLKAGHINDYLDNDHIRPYQYFWLKGSQNTIFLEIVVKHLLANVQDEKFLCRRGKVWDKIRTHWQ
jgi:UDP-N-acetylmuramyl pentapeptide synthase